MMSTFEKIVYQILEGSGIYFEQEKQFKDLYNSLYRFDFYLPDQNAVIEVNGLQHYVFTKQFHANRSDFLNAKERDRRKLAYCLAKNIRAYCIPYWEMGNITKLEDIFQDKFLAHSKFHNDEVWRHQNHKQDS